MREEHLLTGELEPTNEPYAVAKIAGIKLCQSYNRQYGTDFISVMPTNLYGLNDNYHPVNSHVLPALIRRFHEAKVAGAAHGRGLGHRLPPPRVHVRRRHGRRLRLPDADLLRQRLRQHRHRRGHHDPRADRDGRAHRRLQGRDRLGRDQARRHPAQAPRRLAAARARLAPQALDARGADRGLPGLPRERHRR